MKDEDRTKNVVRQQIERAKADGGGTPRTSEQSFHDLNRRRAAEGKPPIEPVPRGEPRRGQKMNDASQQPSHEEFRGRWLQ